MELPQGLCAWNCRFVLFGLELNVLIWFHFQCYIIKVMSAVLLHDLLMR